MLRGIPEILSPELIKCLMEMGHGDEIVIADRNFPAYSKGRQTLRCDGVTIPALLSAIIPMFPLDEAVEYNYILMDVPKELDFVPSVWEKYRRIIETSPDLYLPPLKLEKPDFYARSENAFAVLITGEKERFANVILRKGIIRKEE